MLDVKLKHAKYAGPSTWHYEEGHFDESTIPCGVQEVFNSKALKGTHPYISLDATAELSSIRFISSDDLLEFLSNNILYNTNSGGAL